jgi:hypothetical protein
MTIRERCSWFLGAAVVAGAFGQTQIDVRRQGRNLDFSAGPVKPFQTGTTLPSTCSTGQAFFKTDAPAGQNIYACTAANIWTLETPPAMPDFTGQGGKILAASGSAAQWTGLAGDISGPANTVVVGGIQGYPVSMAAPTGGQVLTWNNSTGHWEPGGPPANYSLTFGSQTSVVIPGNWHGYSTTNLVVECYDPNEKRVEPNNVSIGDATRTVLITFSTPQSGRCVVNGAGGGGGAALPGGTGDGQVLVWSSANNQWVAGSAASPLSILRVARTSATVLGIGQGCSVSSPCNVLIGGSVHSIQGPAAVTIMGGSGTAFFYLDQNGLINVGHNLTVSCSAGCQSVSGLSGFPSNVLPLAAWTATNGVWDATGTDWRPWLSTGSLGAGLGTMVSSIGNVTSIGIDSALVPTYVTGNGSLDFPAIPNGACALELSMPLAGASPGDSVAAGWPATLEQGLIGIMRVSAADTVGVRLCNFSGTAVDPAPAVFGATVVRSF